jgi:hypothetical protein
MTPLSVLYLSKWLVLVCTPLSTTQTTGTQRNVRNSSGVYVDSTHSFDYSPLIHCRCSELFHCKPLLLIVHLLLTMQLFSELAHSNCGEKRTMDGNKLCDLPLESSRDQLHNDKEFEQDSQLDSISSLPRLEQSTVCSSCDDDSSFSSMSSDEAFYQEAKQRSIFGVYWNKHGCKSHQSAAKTEELSRSTQDSGEATSGTKACELSTELPEKTVDKCQSSPNVRRRIFGQLSKSSPTLSLLTATVDVDMRRSKSASSLHSRPKGSCLRLTRFSGCERRTSDASSSVTFSPKVDIVLFQTPSERWAADGWTDWFH